MHIQNSHVQQNSPATLKAYTNAAFNSLKYFMLCFNFHMESKRINPELLCTTNLQSLCFAVFLSPGNTPLSTLFAAAVSRITQPCLQKVVMAKLLQELVLKSTDSVTKRVPSW